MTLPPPLEFDLDDDRDYKVAEPQELPSDMMHGYRLRAVFFIEHPVTVFDDAGPSDDPSRYDVSPTETWHRDGRTPRIARTVVVKQPRYLLRRTEVVDKTAKLRQNIRDLEATKDQAQCENNELNKKVERLEKECNAFRKENEELKRLQRDTERLRVRAEKLLTDSEETLSKLRELFGDELMDKVIQEADTLDAKTLRRQAMEALGEDDE